MFPRRERKTTYLKTWRILKITQFSAAAALGSGTIIPKFASRVIYTLVHVSTCTYTSYLFKQFVSIRPVRVFSFNVEQLEGQQNINNAYNVDVCIICICSTTPKNIISYTSRDTSVKRSHDKLLFFSLEYNMCVSDVVSSERRIRNQTNRHARNWITTIKA